MCTRSIGKYSKSKQTHLLNIIFFFHKHQFASSSTLSRNIILGEVVVSVYIALFFFDRPESPKERCFVFLLQIWETVPWITSYLYSSEEIHQQIPKVANKRMTITHTGKVPFLLLNFLVHALFLLMIYLSYMISLR